MPSTSHPTVPTTPAMPVPVESPLSIHDLTVVLIKHYGLHEGHFDLLVEFQIAVGAIGPDPATPSPGAMIAISKIGLAKPVVSGPLSIDARMVNPKKKQIKKKLD